MQKILGKKFKIIIKKKTWNANDLSSCRVTCSTKEFTGLVYRISQQITVSAYTWAQCVQGWVQHPELTRKGTRADMDVCLQRAA